MRLDYAPATGRSSTKGFRTKKARRRADQRAKLHRSRTRDAQKAKRRQTKLRAERAEAGWWPPTPLTGQPPVWTKGDGRR